MSLTKEQIDLFIADVKESVRQDFRDFEKMTEICYPKVNTE